MPLFDRIARVRVGQSGGDGIEIRDLRIAFAVSKTRTEASNTATIRIYGLKADTRARIRDIGEVVSLDAGYVRDRGLVQVFTGSLTRKWSSFEAPEVITHIEAGDGIKERREVRVSLSFPAGTPARAVLDTIAARLGLRAVRPISALPRESYAHGFAFVGRARDALDRVVDRLGAEWSIQNGELQVLVRGQPGQVTALELSEGSGMVGSPEPVEAVGGDLEGSAERPGFRVRSLLQPTVEPGQRIAIRAREMAGVYRVDSVEHFGDTHGGDWQTEMIVGDFA